MVELCHPRRDVEGVVIREGNHAGSEADATGSLPGGREEELGRADGLPAARMMLAGPELVITESLSLLDQLEVALELQGRMLPDRMVRRQENAEPKPAHSCLRRSRRHRSVSQGYRRIPFRAAGRRL